MGAVASAVPKAVESAVVPSTANSVDVNDTPERLPRKAPAGSPRVAAVPVTDAEANADIQGQPRYGRTAASGSQVNGGTSAAPSVPPMGGVLFTSPPIDGHYLVEREGDLPNPAYAVNRPRARGVVQLIKQYANHIAEQAQDVDNAGWRTRNPQQRTSYLRVTPPPHHTGYVSGEQFAPRQQPQAVRTYRYPPATGTVRYGSGDLSRRVQTGVLNSDTFGAGQTAGGIGGSNYTPQPGPPETNSVSGTGSASSMPTWG